MSSAAGDLKTTIDLSRSFMFQMMWLRLSLNTAEEILHALQQESFSNTSAYMERTGIEVRDHKMSSAWVENLKRHLRLLRNRVTDLIERQRADEATVSWEQPIAHRIY